MPFWCLNLLSFRLSSAMLPYVHANSQFTMNRMNWTIEIKKNERKHFTSLYFYYLFDGFDMVSKTVIFNWMCHVFSNISEIAVNYISERTKLTVTRKMLSHSKAEQKFALPNQAKKNVVYFKLYWPFVDEPFKILEMFDANSFAD